MGKYEGADVKTETFRKVVNIINKVSHTEINDGELDSKTNLFEDLNIDSIVILEIVVEIEMEWGVKLSDEPDLLDAMETIESLCDFLDKKTGGIE